MTRLMLVLALLLPATMIAVALTNLPLPQVSYGSVIRTIGRQEWSHGIPRPILSPMAFGLAGTGFEAVTRHFAAPFGSLGPVSFMLTSLTVMAGVATAPWLLPRTGATPGVYDARKSLGWATVLFGVAMLTMAGVAVFMREFLLDELVGRDLTARLAGVLEEVPLEMSKPLPDGLFENLQRLDPRGDDPGMVLSGRGDNPKPLLAGGTQEVPPHEVRVRQRGLRGLRQRELIERHGVAGVP